MRRATGTIEVQVDWRPVVIVVKDGRIIEGYHCNESVDVAAERALARLTGEVGPIVRLANAVELAVALWPSGAPLFFDYDWADWRTWHFALLMADGAAGIAAAHRAQVYRHPAICALAAHPDPRIRRTALRAAAPVFVDVARHLVNDPDDLVAKKARKELAPVEKALATLTVDAEN